MEAHIIDKFSEIYNALGNLGLPAFLFLGVTCYRYIKPLYDKIENLNLQNQECEKNFKNLMNRLNMLENQKNIPFSWWKKSEDKRYIFISPLFIKEILTPLGIKKEDVLGKLDSEVKGFSNNFLNSLEEVDNKAMNNSSGAVHGVIINESLPKYTIMKSFNVLPDSTIEFVGIACKEI